MGLFFRSAARAGYFREHEERDVREFRALRRRLNFLEQELYTWDGILAGDRSEGDTDHVRRNEILMRNYSDEAWEITFVLYYFENELRRWPNAYAWLFGALVLVSSVLSLLAILR